MTRFICIALVAALSGCAGMANTTHRTTWPSTVVDASKERAKSVAINTIVAQGNSVIDETDSIIKYRQSIKSGFAKTMLSCPACIDPYDEYDLIFSNQNDKTKVTAQVWRVSGNGYGQKERASMMGSDESIYDAQTMLNNIYFKAPR